MPEQQNRYRDWTVSILTHLAFAALVILLGIYNPPNRAWVFILVATVGWFLALGKQQTGYFFGILIDSRNRISLSRAQMIVWSIVVLSGFAAAAFSNIGRDVLEPLAISVPSEIWLLLGISTASLVGSPLLLGVKQDQADGDDVNMKDERDEAALGDMFMGEADGNCDYVDLPRLQMGFFTIVIVLAYSAALGDLFAGLSEREAIRALPGIDKGLLALMGISHTGYLAAKPLRSKPKVETAPKKKVSKKKAKKAPAVTDEGGD